jgi:hypothetical protein
MSARKQSARPEELVERKLAERYGRRGRQGNSYIIGIAVPDCRISELSDIRICGLGFWPETQINSAVRKSGILKLGNHVAR